MPDWYLWLFASSIIYAGVSIISFRQITVRRINREIRESGEYYLSTDDKVGYTLLSIALAILLPLKWAKIAVPDAIIDSGSVKKLRITTKDIFLSTSYIASIVSFLIIGVYSTTFA